MTGSASPSDNLQATLGSLRGIILDAAEATETAPLTETLKWGQPAFVPARKDGTTIRLGAVAGQAALFVHCQTDLVARYRMLFPDDLDYSGNRAVLIKPNRPLPRSALHHIASMALTYHRDKRRAR